MIGSKKLELACGKYPDAEAVNLDIVAVEGCDIVHDLEQYPYPFEDGQFEHIQATDIVEHITDIFKMFAELHRILAPEGIIKIHTNYAGHISAFTDPQHKHFFTLESFDYFDPETFMGREFFFYTPVKFKILEKRVDDSGRGLYFTLKKI